jgi:hypothetical protein
MKEDSLGHVFVRNLVAAIPWGIIFLVIFLVVSLGVRQQIKESMQYAARMAISETSNVALSYPVLTRIKQNIKEGVEFSGKTARIELRNLLHDPQVKEDLKEILESSPKR